MVGCAGVFVGVAHATKVLRAWQTFQTAFGLFRCSVGFARDFVLFWFEWLECVGGIRGRSPRYKGVASLANLSDGFRFVQV